MLHFHYQMHTVSEMFQAATRKTSIFSLRKKYQKYIDIVHTLLKRYLTDYNKKIMCTTYMYYMYYYLCFIVIDICTNIGYDDII